MIKISNLESSYKKNKYNLFFDSIIKIYKPEICYEFGILNGYSTLAIASALKQNGRGHLFACDLFEDYEFKKSNLNDFNIKLKENNLEKYCTSEKINIFEKIEQIKDNSIDFLHLDISNDGEKLIKFVKLLLPKLKKSGIFLFEGGSEERDSVEWMKKYNKQKIQDLFKDEFFINNYKYFTFEPFPSITICSRIDND